MLKRRTGIAFATIATPSAIASAETVFDSSSQFPLNWRMDTKCGSIPADSMWHDHQPSGISPPFGYRYLAYLLFEALVAGKEMLIEIERVLGLLENRHLPLLPPTIPTVLEIVGRSTLK